MGLGVCVELGSKVRVHTDLGLGSGVWSSGHRVCVLHFRLARPYAKG